MVTVTEGFCLACSPSGEVDSVGSHDTVGGELAARDGAHTGCNLGHGVLTETWWMLRRPDLGLQQRAQTGVGADDVLAGQRGLAISLLACIRTYDVPGGDGALAVPARGGVGG